MELSFLLTVQQQAGQLVIDFSKRGASEGKWGLDNDIVDWGQPVPELSGDYDASSSVEQADIDLVLLNWGRAIVDVSDRFDTGWFDDLPLGVVDQAELDKVLLNWGSFRAMSDTSAVPEPPSFVLLLTGVGIAATYAARRNRQGHPHIGGRKEQRDPALFRWRSVCPCRARA